MTIKLIEPSDTAEPKEVRTLTIDRTSEMGTWMALNKRWPEALFVNGLGCFMLEDWDGAVSATYMKTSGFVIGDQPSV